MSYRTATKEDFLKSGFAYKRKSATQEVTKIVASTDLQIGLSGANKSLTVTGASIFELGLSGSLTRLSDERSYLVAGNNVTITSASNGQITIDSIAGTPGGSDTQIQFNDGGSTFGGDSGLTYNKTTGTLTVTGDLAINGGDITTSAATFNLVNAATTINLGSTTVTRAINIGTNATNAQTISVGNGAAANIITIGSTTGAASLTLQAGTGNFSLTGAASTTYTIGPAARTGIISIGNSTATNTIEIGDGSIASGAQQTIDICGANITNNASAYRVINIGTGTGGGASGVANFTTQNRVLVGKVQSASGYTAVAIQGDYIWIGKDGTSNPTSSLIGFFGATPVGRQTVASDTLANLYTALRNLGLIT